MYYSFISMSMYMEGVNIVRDRTFSRSYLITNVLFFFISVLLLPVVAFLFLIVYALIRIVVFIMMLRG